ncbi:PTS system mannitol-specific IIC component [Paenibacillus sp. V4I3]|uniref:PTS sugar transporter subunit IIA n=1 Tax=Paenibacillus sp. V4I3 TaxID=3042305 RepID=UPI0027818C61|nr:PTS sugar transporter subunit IIA [Paenibacillus sp. V4I3]MDQ0873989.1 PTS system mannitol-specific IIC component [Paenibacillus sp. V4I3]
MMKTLDRVGRFLSTMVFQNIAGLIALGMLRVLFGSNGWWPLRALNGLITPMTQYLIPILFGYTGGKMIGNHRGGVIAAFVIIGLVAGNPSEYTMTLPAMIIGPTMGFIIKKTDKWLVSRIPLGLELLYYSTIAGLIGVFFVLMAYYYISPAFVQGLHVIVTGSGKLVSSGYLWLIALVIEPAKILFFNNVINHGILEPLGINQTKEFGKSIFFLLETNPGPGFGLLMAYFIRSIGKEKGNARSAVAIQLIGGIHEVYFPYALRKPLLILPLILGGMAGDFVFSVLHAGLVATPSPGSILTQLLLAPKGMHISVLLGFSASACVSFFWSIYVLSRAVTESNDSKDNNKMPVKQQIQSITEKKPVKLEQKVIFACDAGMGSSAMGAALLRKKLKQADLHFVVDNCSVDDLSDDADIVISHIHLTERAKASAPHARHFSINSFLDQAFYEELVVCLKQELGSSFHEETTVLVDMTVFTPEHIMIQLDAIDKWEAISQVGEILIRTGHVEEEFIQEMHLREQMLSTYIGNGIAIPHGMDGDSKHILKSGIAIAQYPEGIDFGDGDIAYLLIAVVGHHSEKLELVSHIALMIDNVEFVNQLIQAKNRKEIYSLVCNSFAEMDRIR